MALAKDPRHQGPGYVPRFICAKGMSGGVQPVSFLFILSSISDIIHLIIEFIFWGRFRGPTWGGEKWTKLSCGRSLRQFKRENNGKRHELCHWYLKFFAYSFYAILSYFFVLFRQIRICTALLPDYCKDCVRERWLCEMSSAPHRSYQWANASQRSMPRCSLVRIRQKLKRRNFASFGRLKKPKNSIRSCRMPSKSLRFCSRQ